MLLWQSVKCENDSSSNCQRPWRVTWAIPCGWTQNCLPSGRSSRHSNVISNWNGLKNGDGLSRTLTLQMLGIRNWHLFDCPVGRCKEKLPIVKRWYNYCLHIPNIYMVYIYSHCINPNIGIKWIQFQAFSLFKTTNDMYRSPLKNNNVVLWTIKKIIKSSLYTFECNFELKWVEKWWWIV
jgi:hypothetical protein